MYPVREARIKRPSHWEFSATGLAVPSKALGPLVSAWASLGLFPPLRNALMLDCSPPSSSVSGISEARILEGVPLPSLQGSIWKIFSPGLWFWWRKGDPFQGLRVDSYLTLWNELAEERSTIQARDFIGKGCRGRGWGKQRELLCHVAHRLRVYGHCVSFWFVSCQSFWIGILPGGTRITQLRWIPARRILGSC